MESREVFDLIPSEFDLWRPRYCKQAFNDIIAFAELGKGKSVLEIGPGTGQATSPLLETGCDYTGIELGKHLCAFAREKFSAFLNCLMLNGDFCTYDFQNKQFDMIFSAAAIQWIPEKEAFTRAFELLRPGGCLVMIANIGDDAARNSTALVAANDEVYKKYFTPEIPYTCKINKGNAVNYGFLPIEVSNFTYDTDMTADEFVHFTMTHADHITLREPNRSLFMAGLARAIDENGGVWRRRDRVNVVKTRKPER